MSAHVSLNLLNELRKRYDIPCSVQKILTYKTSHNRVIKIRGVLICQFRCV